MKVAITFNKLELESLAAIAESSELRTALKNLGVKPKKTSYSPVEKLGLMFGKPITRTAYGFELKFTKTMFTITGDIDLVTSVQEVVDFVSNKKQMNKQFEKLAKRLDKTQIKHLETIISLLSELSEEARFQRLMS